MRSEFSSSSSKFVYDNVKEGKIFCHTSTSVQSAGLVMGRNSKLVDGSFKLSPSELPLYASKLSRDVLSPEFARDSLVSISFFSLLLLLLRPAELLRLRLGDESESLLASFGRTTIIINSGHSKSYCSLLGCCESWFVQERMNYFLKKKSFYYQLKFLVETSHLSLGIPVLC